EACRVPAVSIIGGRRLGPKREECGREQIALVHVGAGRGRHIIEAPARERQHTTGTLLEQRLLPLLALTLLLLDIGATQLSTRGQSLRNTKPVEHLVPGLDAGRGTQVLTERDVSRRKCAA